MSASASVDSEGMETINSDMTATEDSLSQSNVQESEHVSVAMFASGSKEVNKSFL